MRIVYKGYSDGGFVVEQTDDDGAHPQALDSKQSQSADDADAKRVSTYIVVNLDATDQETQRAMEAAREVSEHVAATRARREFRLFLSEGYNPTVWAGMTSMEEPDTPPDPSRLRNAGIVSEFLGKFPQHDQHRLKLEEYRKQLMRAWRVR